MGYIVKTWDTIKNLDPNNLNRIEQGIKTSHDTIEILSEEVSNLQLKQLDIVRDLNTLIKDSPNIIKTLTDITNILNNNDVSSTLNNVDTFLSKLPQTLSVSEIKQIYKNLKLDSFLHLSDIRVNNSSIVKDNYVNIEVPLVDTSLNINSYNAISNSAVTSALDSIGDTISNYLKDINIPTRLSELEEDDIHQVVTKKEKSLWNSYEYKFLTELPEHNHDLLYSKLTHTHEDIISLIPVVPRHLSQFINDVPYASEEYVKQNGGKIDKVYINLIEQPITNKQLYINIPTDLGDFTNNVRYIKSGEEEDPTVPAWAKEKTKPFYTYNEILNRPTKLSDLTNDLDFISKSSIETLISNSGKTTKDYTDTTISNLIDSAPDTLNTLNELAIAIQNNDSLIDTLNSAIGTKADKTDLDNYLPLTAGPDKKVTGDLYVQDGTNTKNLYLGKNARLRDNGAGAFVISTSGSLYFRPSGDGNATNGLELTSSAFKPQSNEGNSLGTSGSRWKEIHGTAIYQNGKQVANKEDIPTDYAASSHSHTKADITDFSHTHTKSEITDFDNYLPLAGGTLTGHLTGPSFTGRLRGTDTRSANGAPSTYQTSAYGISEFQEFKGASTIGAPNTNEKSFVYLKTYVPWGDSSGGLPSQLAIGDGLAYRTASSDSVWNAWKTLATTEDLANYVTLNTTQTITGTKTFGTIYATTIYLS